MSLQSNNDNFVQWHLDIRFDIAFTYSVALCVVYFVCCLFCALLILCVVCFVCCLFCVLFVLRVVCFACCLFCVLFVLCVVCFVSWA
jgi:hypothetical protein